MVSQEFRWHIPLNKTEDCWVIIQVIVDPLAQFGQALDGHKH
jgi:hypothetical protein